MGVTIENGFTGAGYEAKVDKNGRLGVNAVARPIQHVVSEDEGDSYQVEGLSATLTSATHAILHIKNNSETKAMVITHIRHQVLGSNATIPNITGASEYFELAFGRTYGSGGVAVTPVNVNTASGKIAPLTVYNASPTLAGTALGFDKYFTKTLGEMYSYNKEGAVIIAPGDTMELSYVTASTAGKVYCRVSFFMDDGAAS